MAVNLGAALFAHLAADPTVGPLTLVPGTSPAMHRIFPSQIPQGQAMPAIRYDEISKVREQTLGGPSAYSTTRIQVDVWADTDAEVTTMADAVSAAIDGTTGTFGGANIQHAYLEDVGRLPEFDDDEKGYRVTMDLVILSSD